MGTGIDGAKRAEPLSVADDHRNGGRLSYEYEFSQRRDAPYLFLGSILVFVCKDGTNYGRDEISKKESPSLAFLGLAGSCIEIPAREG